MRSREDLLLHVAAWAERLDPLTHTLNDEDLETLYAEMTGVLAEEEG